MYKDLIESAAFYREAARETSKNCGLSPRNYGANIACKKRGKKTKCNKRIKQPWNRIYRKDDIMSIAKKDRFIDTNLRVVIGSTEQFPPDSFKFNGEEYIVLGRSNKDDLIPINVDNIELQEILTLGGLSQFICTDDKGNIFDVCLYKHQGETVLFAIRTRERPDKPKKQKDNAGLV